MPRLPNILLLTADQQRHDTIAALGAAHMSTPALDRLAAEGTAHLRAHTPNPICVPARHNILTGLPARYHGYASNFRHPLPPGLPTLPRLLAERGYATAAIGKMHFRPARAHHGFERMLLMEEIPTHPEDDEYLRFLRDHGRGDLLNVHGIRHLGYHLPQRSLVPERLHGSRWVADQSCAFIEANRDRPWFLWSSWIAPHPPANVPDSHADHYRGAALPPPCGGAPEPPELRRFRELYAAAITHVDACVGSILDCLDRSGLGRDTLVIYTSDHGEMNGDHGWFSKGLPYEGSVRVPLLVRMPGRVRAGARSRAFADLNDILPTALDAAGIDLTEVARAHGLRDGFPGSSLLRRGGRDRTCQYAEYHRGQERWIMLRDDRWKYVRWFADGREELYDLKRDPGESTDMAAAAAGRAALVRLRRMALAHERRWGLADSVRDGRLAVHGGAFPRADFRTQRPPGAATQWPVYHGAWTAAALYRQDAETLAAVRREPVGVAARAQMDSDLAALWHAEYRRRGGTKAGAARLLASGRATSGRPGGDAGEGQAVLVPDERGD